MPRPCLSCCLVVLLSFLGVARQGAATVWTETGAKIDTVVVDTDTTLPANNLASVAAPVPFKGFRYPHVDGEQNVTVIADDPCFTEGGVHHGIYRSFAADGRLEALVSQTDRIPGTRRKLDLLRGLQMDEFGINFVFNATATREGDNERGLYYWAGGKLMTIARVGLTTLPGGSVPLSDVHWGAVHSGRILYGATEGNQQPALVLHDLKTRADRVLVRGGDAIPGRAGEKFSFVAHQDWLDGSSVVFRAGTAALNNPNTFSAGPQGGVYGWFNVRWDDPAALDPARLVTVADWQTPVPGLDGQHFTEFYSAPVRGGLVAFRGETSHDRGIYVSQAGGPVQSVVDTQTEIAGLFKGKFTGFGYWPAAVENGVVFTANAGRFTGVFFYRVDQEALYLLADNRALVEGKKISNFEIGSHPLVGNRFAITANFADQSAGVYLATIPARAYNRLSAPTNARKGICEGY